MGWALFIAHPFFLGVRNNQQLQAQRHLHEEQLKVYRAIEAKYFQDISYCETALRFQYLTLRRGIRIEEDWISWCDEVINVI